MLTRQRLFQIIILAHAAAFLLLAIFVKIHPQLRIDLVLTEAIQRINLPMFEQLMRILTQLGYPTLGAVATLIFALIIGYKTSWRTGLLIIFSSAGAYLISEVVKNLINRPRPDNPLIFKLDSQITTSSFPSGHVLHYLGLYGFLFFLSYVNIQNPRLRLASCSLLAAVIFFGGLSRIYLGAHWFSDVVGSYLIGFVWLYLMSIIYRRFKATKSD